MWNKTSPFDIINKWVFVNMGKLLLPIASYLVLKAMLEI